MGATTHRSPGETFAGHTTLIARVCGNCGVMFAMPEALDEQCHRDHDRTWYCPNGHPRQYVGETEAEKQERLRRYAEERETAQRAAREQAEASARAQRAAATRARNERDANKRRAAHGVCPCCHRSFKQLRAHVARMHPEALAEATP